MRLEGKGTMAFLVRGVLEGLGGKPWKNPAFLVSSPPSSFPLHCRAVVLVTAVPVSVFKLHGSETFMIKQSMTGLWRGALAGLTGGALVGMGEALALVTSMGEAADRSALPYASVLYGLIGMSMGGGLGLLAGAVLGIRKKALTPSWAYGLGFIGPFFPLGLVLLVWTLKRDMYAEKMPPLPILAGAGVGWLALSCLLLLVLVNATRKSFLSFLTTVPGGIGGWVALMALAWLGTFGGSKATPVPPGGTAPAGLQDKPNIILIMVDTLRADALGVYGNPGNPSPTVDALAKDAVVFTNNHSQASWTRASTATLLTSLFPSSHNSYRKADALPQDVETLPEVLLSKGYYTGGMVNNTNVTAQFGFDQGFSTFTYLEPENPFGAKGSAYFLAMYSVVRKVSERLVKSKDVDRVYWEAPRVTAAATDWIGLNKNSRFFLFLHYMDPHDPYFRHPHDGFAYSRAEHEKPDPSMTEDLKKLYDGEVRYFDTHFAPLVKYLKDNGLYDNTIIALTADHGEEFGEHKGYWHGTTLYEEQIHTPLIIKLPRQEMAGTLRTELVRTMDVAPTVTSLAGIPPYQTWQGVSLLGDWNARAEKDRQSFAEQDFEGNVLASLNAGDWKIIRANADNPRGLKPCELYHLANDPLEQQNLCEGSADPAASSKKTELMTALEGAESFARGQAVERAEGGMDAATCEKLKALGYVDAGVDCSTYGTGGAKPSP